MSLTTPAVPVKREPSALDKACAKVDEEISRHLRRLSKRAPALERVAKGESPFPDEDYEITESRLRPLPG